MPCGDEITGVSQARPRECKYKGKTNPIASGHNYSLSLEINLPDHLAYENARSETG